MDQDAVWGFSTLSQGTSQHIRICASSIVQKRKLADAQEGKLIPLVLELNNLAFHPTTKPGSTKPLCSLIPFARKTSKTWLPFYQNTQLLLIKTSESLSLSPMAAPFHSLSVF